MGRSTANDQTASTRVALLCPRALAREGLCRVLEADAFQVAWQGEDGLGLIDSLDGCSPDLILLAWEAPGVGVSFIKELLTSGVQAPIVVMAQPNSHDDLGQALKAGAVGCLSCNMDALDFLSALKMLAHGDIVVSHEVIPATTGADDSERLEKRLTARELEVLRAIGRGATNQEIADELHLSPHTAKIHVHQVLVKMGFRNRLQATAYAARRDIL